ncbi:MAG: hypothetical protein H0U79_02875 [Solirubrobacterales bacterium]|nr:hypothetical protein [Solirubrobacterales bacterium]
MQEFLGRATQKASADLEASLLRLPENKRDWSPMGGARTALDMVAECAIINGSTVDLIQTRVFPADFDMAAFHQARAELSRAGDVLMSLLHENAAKVAAVIEGVDENDLNAEVSMPWGPMTLAQVMAYPYWNMSYHEGQINYIASLLAPNAE